MDRKRKSSGGGGDEGPTNRRKLGAAMTATPTQTEDSSSNSDMDMDGIPVEEELDRRDSNREPEMPTTEPDIGRDVDGATSTFNRSDSILSLSVQAKDEEIGRLAGELQAATGQIELLQQQVHSKSSTILELSSKINLFEEEARNCGAECKVLKEELEEARIEIETLRQKLHIKRVDLERQTSRTKMLEEEQSGLVQENSRTVERLEEELKRNTNLLKNTISGEKAVAGKHNEEIGALKTEIRQLNSENERLNKSVILQQASENKRLQDDNADLRRVITENDEVSKRQAGKIEGLLKDLKVLEDVSNGRRAELDEARKQQEDGNRKIDLLENSISEKDKELARFQAKYLRDQEGNYQLHSAAKEGDEQAVKNLLELGADVNSRNYNGDTPVILAASSGADVALKLIKLLTEHGADVFATGGWGQTFLHKFLSNENPPTSSQFHDILDHLVSQNLTSLFNIRESVNGTTAFMLAARNVDLDMATIYLLKENRVDFTLLDKNGLGSVSYAAEGNRNVSLLLKLNGRGSLKYNCLARAIKAEDEYSLLVLVLRGSDVNEKNKYFLDTPLHLAAKSRNTRFSINAIKLLITSGADVDAKDNYGKIFLHDFVDNTHRTINPAEFHDLVSFIISKDLCRLFNIPGVSDGTTPFHTAVLYLEIETATLALLKDNGADFNAVGTNSQGGFSILYYATMHDRSLRLISDLVVFGADPKHLTDTGESMLHEAAANGRLDLLKFFLDHGLNVNARDGRGRTPLHCAIEDRESIIVTLKILLRNGANPEIVDEKGKSVRDYFNERRHSYSDAEQISNCFSLGSSC